MGGESQWVTWALQALIAAVLYVIWGQISSAREAISALQTEIAKNYMPRAECVELVQRTKDDVIKNIDRVHTALHEVRNMALVLKAKDEMRADKEA